MRRLAAILMLTLLSACSTVDDLSPLAPSSQTVALRAPRFEDSKPHEWDSGAPWNYAVHGTDVSKYQTSVDWPTAKASGISFAFIKATEGGDRFDDYFNEHWARTKAVGIPRAAYH
ncbi:MAG: glycoside hydrolase, partial [Mesorhizobium sp.]